jgi:hypothetical protein
MASPAVVAAVISTEDGAFERAFSSIALSEGDELQPTIADDFNLCRCSCGACEFRVTGKPLFRIFCHCTICRRFNAAPFADVVMYRSRDVENPTLGAVNFETYRPPPNVQSGKCAKCSKAAIEVFESRLLPSLTMVPFTMFESGTDMAQPSAHVFYEKRETEVNDALPKHCGYLRSQAAFGRYLVLSLLRR